MDASIDVARNYWRFCFEGADDDEAHAAFLELNDIVKASPELAWSVLLQLVARASTPSQFAALGAGPLEDLLATHPGTVLPLLNAELPRNAGMRSCLQAISRSRLATSTVTALLG